MPRYVHSLWQQRCHHSLVTICQYFDNNVFSFRSLCTEQVSAATCIGYPGNAAAGQILIHYKQIIKVLTSMD